MIWNKYVCVNVHVHSQMYIFVTFHTLTNTHMDSEEKHFKLGASIQALTLMILHIDFDCVVMNMFLTYRIWCEWEKYPGIRALVSLSSVKKICTYDKLDLTAARKSELTKNHGMDWWTSKQKMCFLTTNISSITPPITLQPRPFERFIWNHLVNFFTLTIYLHK